jgi:hypothetical protein
MEIGARTHSFDVDDNSSLEGQAALLMRALPSMPST